MEKTTLRIPLLAYFACLLLLGSSHLPAQVLSWGLGDGPHGSGATNTLTFGPNGGLWAANEVSDTVDILPGPGAQLHFLPPTGTYSFLSRYDAYGQLIWTTKLGSPTPNICEANAIAVDSLLNVYIACRHNGDSIDLDPSPANFWVTAVQSATFLAKYDSLGKFLWAVPLDGYGTESIDAVNLSPDGQVYITGRASSPVDFDPGPGSALLSPASIGQMHRFVAKYSAAGQYRWAMSIHSGNSSPPIATAMPDGGLCAAFRYIGTSYDADPGPGVWPIAANGNADIALMRYDSIGNLIWAHSVGGNNFEQVGSLCADPMGNVYLTGIFFGTADFDPGAGNNILSATVSNTFVQSLDVQGNFRWARQLEGGQNISNSIAYAANELLVGGYFRDSIDLDPGAAQAVAYAPDNDAYVLQLSSQGNLVDYFTLGGPDFDLVHTVTLTAGRMAAGGQTNSRMDIDPGPDSTIVPDEVGVRLWMGVYVPCASRFSANDTICSGDSILFHGQYYHQPGAYTYGVSGNGGCDTISYLQLEVDTVNALVSQSTDTLFAPPGAMAYAWWDCDTQQLIPGATMPWFHPTMAGSYAAIVYGATCTDTSSCYAYMPVAVSVPQEELPGVSPNPATEWLQIRANPDQWSTANVYDPMGRQLISLNIRTFRTWLKVDHLAPGHYYIRLVPHEKLAPSRQFRFIRW